MDQNKKTQTLGDILKEAAAGPETVAMDVPLLPAQARFLLDGLALLERNPADTAREGIATFVEWFKGWHASRGSDDETIVYGLFHKTDLVIDAYTESCRGRGDPLPPPRRTIQSVASDVGHRAQASLLLGDIGALGGRAISTVHDEVVVDVAAERAVAVADRLALDRFTAELDDIKRRLIKLGRGELAERATPTAGQLSAFIVERSLRGWANPVPPDPCDHMSGNAGMLDDGACSGCGAVLDQKLYDEAYRAEQAGLTDTARDWRLVLTLSGGRGLYENENGEELIQRPNGEWTVRHPGSPIRLELQTTDLDEAKRRVLWKHGEWEAYRERARIAASVGLSLDPKGDPVRGIPERCPDRGACHHECRAACWRVLNAGPLSSWGQTPWGTGTIPDDKLESLHESCRHIPPEEGLKMALLDRISAAIPVGGLVPSETRTFERVPEGDYHINNCQMAHDGTEGGCGVCGGLCPDRRRFLNPPGPR